MEPIQTSFMARVLILSSLVFLLVYEFVLVSATEFVLLCAYQETIIISPRTRYLNKM